MFKIKDIVFVYRRPTKDELIAYRTKGTLWTGGSDNIKERWLRDKTPIRIDRFFTDGLDLIGAYTDEDGGAWTVPVSCVRHFNKKQTVIICNRK